MLDADYLQADEGSSLMIKARERVKQKLLSREFKKCVSGLRAGRAGERGARVSCGWGVEAAERDPFT